MTPCAWRVEKVRSRRSLASIVKSVRDLFSKGKGGKWLKKKSEVDYQSIHRYRRMQTETDRQTETDWPIDWSPLNVWEKISLNYFYFNIHNLKWSHRENLARKSGGTETAIADLHNMTRWAWETLSFCVHNRSLTNVFCCGNPGVQNTWG